MREPAGTVAAYAYCAAPERLLERMRLTTEVTGVTLRCRRPNESSTAGHQIGPVNHPDTGRCRPRLPVASRQRRGLEYGGAVKRTGEGMAGPHCAATALIAAGALMLAACSGSPAPEGDPIRAARALRDAPLIVQEGNAADTCGEFVLDQTELVPINAVACLDTAAAAGEEAELAWSSLTDEGDPVVSFAYTAPWNAGIVFSLTNEYNSYADDHGWTTGLCPDATTATSDFSPETCPGPVEG